MAVASDYTAGTVTAAAGGTTVTGTGTAWQTAQFKEGDRFIANGWDCVIASVDSETQITLDENGGVRGAALAAAGYRMRYMSDGSRSSAQARALINLLGGGSMQALAGLTGAADKLPYFTGAGTAALATLTAFARTLLDDPDVVTLLRTLGLNTAAGQTNAPIRLRGLLGNQVEFGHLNGAGYGSSIGCNVGNGEPFLMFFAEAGSSNNTFRTRGHTGIGIQANRANGGLDIVAVPVADADNQDPVIVASVGADGSIYSGTEKIVDSAGLLYQDGRRVVENGANANGTYTRFADGTQICNARITGSLQSNFAVGSIFRANHLTWTFPAAFVDSNAAVNIGFFANSVSADVDIWGGNSYTVTPTTCQLNVLSATSHAAATRTILAQAVGRWF